MGNEGGRGRSEDSEAKEGGVNHEEAMALKIGDRFDRADGFEWEVVGTTNSHVVVKVVRGAVNVLPPSSENE